MRAFGLSAAALLCAAAVWAADAEVDGGPAAFCISGKGGPGATMELKWDDGRPTRVMSWNTGADSWVGNDFDISTLGGSWWVKTIKVMSGPSWPNGRWDGFRLGVFTFSGGLPGSVMHGPAFVRGSGAGYRWCGFNFGMWTWSLGNHKKFVVALEQYYNYPDCDPYVLDGNSKFQGHSWQYQRGKWETLVGSAGYRNLMLRVVISDLMAVAPTSLGRVKALYY